MLALFIVFIITLLICIRLSKVFERSGQVAWYAYIPFFNLWIWNKHVLGRPIWWFFLACIPVINIVIILSMLTDTLMAFGVHRIRDHVCIMIAPFIYLPYFGLKDTSNYLGVHSKRPPYNHSSWKSWIDAITYAMVAAFILRSFSVEMFQIPTSSMEKSLLVGDFLLVNKFKYGARIPMTPIGIPFFHNNMMIFGPNTNSYLDWVQLPEIRFPKFSDVNRNDIVVFNHAAGDTIMAGFTQKGIQYYKERNQFFNIKYQNLENKYGNNIPINEYYKSVQYNFNFNQLNFGAMLYLEEINKWSNYIQERNGTKRKKALKKARQIVQESFEIKVRPIDKRDHYVKRCVGIAGDTLEIVNGNVIINNDSSYSPKFKQLGYFLNKRLTNVEKKELNIRESGGNLVFVTESEAENIKVKKQTKLTANIETKESTPSHIYPNWPEFFPWNRDNFGPIIIPAKGMIIELNGKNLLLYKRCIEAYEGNTLSVKGGKIYVNNKESKTYTFRKNYYWMMGDNRHNSQDSRYWGFVPDDHIVGTPWLVLFSKDLDDWFFQIWKWRWDRVLKLAND